MEPVSLHRAETLYHPLPLAGDGAQPQRGLQVFAVPTRGPVFPLEAPSSIRYFMGLIVSAIIRTSTRP
jgi:hypothetical protein